MNANEKGFHNLMRLALKFLVKDEGDAATCIKCGYKQDINPSITSSSPLYSHIKSHVEKDEITVTDLLGRY